KLGPPRPLPHPQIRAVPDQLPDHLVDGAAQLLALPAQIGIVVLARSARDREVAAFGKGLDEILAIREKHGAGIARGWVPRLFWDATEPQERQEICPKALFVDTAMVASWRKRERPPLSMGMI